MPYIIPEDVPDQLNGYDVIRVQINPASNMAAVMVQREHPMRPYVVASWYPALGTTWSSGDYVATVEEANKSFTNRCSSLAKY